MHWLLLASALAVAQGGQAQPDPEEREKQEKKKLEEEIAKELGQQPGSSSGAGPPSARGGDAPAPASGSPPPEPAAPTGGNPFARLMLLPDISAVGSAALAYASLDVERLSPRGDPFAPPHKLKPLFQELELGIQAVVDPYARADVFLSFGAGGAEIEEAYLTTLRLPGALQARAGKMFAPFGRINQQHGHVWTFVDRPLALSRFLGPDALKGPGIDVAWLAPTPWYAEVRLAFMSAPPAFETVERNGGYARLTQFFEVSEGATLGVGFSGARLEEEGAGAWRDLYGADVFLKIRPPQTRSYLALQGEVLARRLDPSGLPADPAAATELPGTLWGGYVQASLRDGPFREYGLRYERAPAVGLATGAPENRLSALASWLPSEFLRLRAQVAWDRLPDGRDGFEGLLQVEFSIGAHGAHPF